MSLPTHVRAVVFALLPPIPPPPPPPDLADWPSLGDHLEISGARDRDGESVLRNSDDSRCVDEQPWMGPILAVLRIFVGLSAMRKPYKP